MDKATSEPRRDHSPGNGPEILVRRQGAVGRITLNRLAVHNALNGEMITVIRSALTEFATSPSISLIIIDSASPRVFCIGGDLDPVRHFVQRGQIHSALTHCKREYDLDLAIANYTKPVFALIDGLVMGGGIGIACHASHPVITDRARLALPETGIGWVPDSGINAILAKASGKLGAWLALTGAKIGAGDMLHMGFAHHIIPTTSMHDLVAALAQSGNPDMIADFATLRPKGKLADIEPEINQAFAGANLDTIVARLQNHASGSWQASALRRIERNSKPACEMALGVFTAIKPETSLAAAIEIEFRAITQLISHPGFAGHRTGRLLRQNSAVTT